MEGENYQVFLLTLGYDGQPLNKGLFVRFEDGRMIIDGIQNRGEIMRLVCSRVTGSTIQEIRSLDYCKYCIWKKHAYLYCEVKCIRGDNIQAAAVSQAEVKSPESVKGTTLRKYMA